MSCLPLLAFFFLTFNKYCYYNIIYNFPFISLPAVRALRDVVDTDCNNYIYKCIDRTALSTQQTRNKQNEIFFILLLNS